MSKIKIVSLRRAEVRDKWAAEFILNGQRREMHFRFVGDLLQAKVHLRSRIVDHLEMQHTFKPAETFQPISEPIEPPRLAEFLLQLFASKRSVDAQLGDLQEMFAKNCAKFGSVRANRLYWAQVLRAIGPGLWRRIKRLGLIAFLIDYGRSKLGF
jgi:hypothetical protein